MNILTIIAFLLMFELSHSAQEINRFGPIVDLKEVEA